MGFLRLDVASVLEDETLLMILDMKTPRISPSRTMVVWIAMSGSTWNTFQYEPRVEYSRLVSKNHGYWGA